MIDNYAKQFPKIYNAKLLINDWEKYFLSMLERNIHLICEKIMGRISNLQHDLTKYMQWYLALGIIPVSQKNITKHEKCCCDIKDASHKVEVGDESTIIAKAIRNSLHSTICPVANSGNSSIVSESECAIVMDLNTKECKAISLYNFETYTCYKFGDVNTSINVIDNESLHFEKAIRCKLRHNMRSHN